MRRVVALLGFIFLAVVSARAFEAGAAKVDISPPLGTPLNGYLDRWGRGAIAVHDPVWARCVFLNDDTTQVLIVNTDLCLINRELRNRVLELAPPGVPKENIIITATHTHNGQGGMVPVLWARSISGRYMPDVLEATARKIAESMKTALANRKRATIGYALTEQKDLSINREVDDGPIDQQIAVIRVDDSDGNAIAIITNFAAHPTTVGGADHMSVSADYPGFYYTEMERLAGANCVAMFLNGSEGNQRPANPENKDGWARTESIGRILATRAWTVAEKIKCADGKLHLGYAAPDLPKSLASDLMPSSTVLHTLEINDLLMTFFPGEPCVQIGAELRRQALARGYAAQCTVALSDDHLMYFVPRELYPTQYYECGMNFYGPHIDTWFYSQFNRLMTKGQAPPERPQIAELKAQQNGPSVMISLAGDAYTMGYQRGAAFHDSVAGAFKAYVVKPCDDGAWIPKTGLWSWAPSFVNLTTLALPRLGIGARPMLATLSPEFFDEAIGMADGAGLPFDAVWLTQCAATYSAQSDTGPMYRSPFCTMFAAVGDRAGADNVLVGRNFDWPDKESPIVSEITPATGRHFLEIGFPWSLGVYTGMNDVGLVLCVERAEHLGDPTLDGPPVEFVVRGVLQGCATLAEAVAALQAATQIHGYHVLVADATGVARVLEFGSAVNVREPIDGILLGLDPATAGADPVAATRYARAGKLVSTERIVDAKEMGKFLGDSEPGKQGQERILNERTQYSVVFLPKTKRFYISYPVDGKLSDPIVYAFERPKR